MGLCKGIDQSRLRYGISLTVDRDIIRHKGEIVIIETFTNFIIIKFEWISILYLLNDTCGLFHFFSDFSHYTR